MVGGRDSRRGVGGTRPSGDRRVRGSRGGVVCRSTPRPADDDVGHGQETNPVPDGTPLPGPYTAVVTQ